jgi:hypothetical protein
MNKMGFDGKGLGKNGQGIHKPIEICIRPRNEGLGYELVKQTMRISNL